MDKEIDFDLLGISEAIRLNRFVVPPNQREYSWNDEQVVAFLDDIQVAIRTPDRPYFLGTIVLTLGKGEQLDVADGQQRLSTTTMVLAAIRDYYRGKGLSEMANSIQNDFLSTFDIQTEQKESKLKLNTDDNHFFVENVIHTSSDRKAVEPAKRSHRLIQEAYQIIKQRIFSYEKNGGPEYAKSYLKDWMHYLQRKAKVMMLTVSNSESAFKMFETLNDRGLKTSQVDLVKNHIFSMADDRLPEAQRFWSSMRTAIETVSDNNDDITLEFLRSVCCLMNGPTTKQDILKVLKEKTSTKTEAMRVMTELESISKEYAALLNSDHFKWNKYPQGVGRSLQTMALLGATQIRPLMLAMAIAFDEKETDAAFRKCISWTVRFFIRNIRGGRLDDGYANLANKVYIKQIKNANDLKSAAKDIVVPDGEFRASFEAARSGTAKIARYYLRSLETSAQNQPDAEFIPNDDTGAINLEHVLPNNPDPGTWLNVTEQDMESHFARLGNLALLKAVKNNDIGNKSFEEKKKVYKDSTYLLTEQLKDVVEWNTQEIDERQKVLAELALKTWPL